MRADLLSEYGVDMAVWLRDRRYLGLLQLIEQLPDASRLNEAIQNDPEQAELIARNRFDRGDDDGESWSPRISEYDLTATLLRDIRESIGRLHETTAALHRSKVKVPEFPAPRTEIDRALARLERAWSNEILTRYGFNSDQF